MDLRGRTVFVTGASRGIGRAIALRCASDGANVVIAAKTEESRERRKGSIHDTAREVEAAGGRALAVRVDVREAEQIAAAVEQAAARFGGIDALVNNAGAIVLRPVADLPLRKFDLMAAINLRGPMACAQACIPHLRKSSNAHILNIAPPIDLKPKWFRGTTAYTVTKFGMSLLTIGLAEELRADGIAVNSLWPRTTIATAAIDMLGGEELRNASRTPEIVADAAHAIVTSPSRERTGRMMIDEDVLRERGVTDLSKYAVAPGTPLCDDLYVGDGWPAI